MTIDAIIVDLDNCLAAATEVGQALVEPMFVAIRCQREKARTVDM